ncbi:hypothetical protein Tco_1264408 [Tanacetum coccineum]
MALSSALKATIALLIIVVVVTVVVVVVTVVVVVVVTVVVVVVVVVTVVVVVVTVVVVVVVVGIGRSAPTILGQMTNPFAVIAPCVGLACVLPFILLVLIVLGKIIIKLRCLGVVSNSSSERVSALGNHSAKDGASSGIVCGGRYVEQKRMVVHTMENVVPAPTTVGQPPRKDPQMEYSKIEPQSEQKYR